MRAPQAEVHKLLAGRKQHMPGGLGRYQRLEMQKINKPRFHELRLRQRRRYAQDGLVAEKDGAFRHGMHVAGKPEGREVVQKILPETPGSRKPFNFACRKMQGLKIAERLLQPSRHQKPPV